ncbi:MAG: hypothetical protein AAFU64_14610, partial [Bacteroidota bacterium]
MKTSLPYWLIIGGLLVLPQVILAQNEGNIWYFGDKAGLDFNSGIPQVNSSGQLDQLEGSSSISDLDGQLLFYSDGVRIWNRQHQLMPNGQDLLGHFSSTTSALIVPKPCDPYLYYVFTSTSLTIPPEDTSISTGVYYSVVDMRLDEGRGDVVKEWKNIALSNPAAEKILAVPHANQRDFWILTRPVDSDEIHAFVLGPLGLKPEPVRSKSPYYIENCPSVCGTPG